MADNIELDAGSGGSTVATDDVSGVHYQLVQLVTGADGGAKTLVTGSAGVPVTDASGSLTVDAPVATPVFVRLSDGSAAISTLPVSLASVPSHAVTNAGTFAVQAAQSGTWTVDLGATDNAVLDAIAASLAGTLTVGSHAVTNAGTFAVQVDGAALTALQLIDNAVHADDAAFTLGTSSGVMVMGFAGTQSVDANDACALACDTDGALHIADGGNSITVDNGGTFAVQATCTNAGTFAVQAAQSGTWTVDLGATDNAVLDAIAASLAGTLTVGSHAVTNAGTFAVQAAQSGTWNVTNISGTVSLPTGAATAAKQPALGTAGSASSDVITIQGIASMTAVTVDGSGVTQPVSHAALTELAAAIDTEVQCDIVGALPAGTNLLGRVSASLETGTVYQGTTARTPAFAAIDAASSGDNTVVAAQGASNKIRVLSLFLVSSGTVNVRFESGAGGTALTGQMNLVANSGFVLPFNPAGWFETAANTLLNLELSGAVSVDGCLTYIVVT